MTDHEATGGGFDLNLLIFGIALSWRPGRRTIEFWIGPWGVLFKFHIMIQRRDGRLFRFGADLGRSFLATTFFELTLSENGLAQRLELLIGPFGYLVRLVQRLHVQPGNNLFRWVVRLGPDGVLFAHALQVEKSKSYRILLDDALGPFRALARFLFDWDYEYGGPARLTTSVLVGPGGYVLRAEANAKRKIPGKARVFFTGSIGPGGAAAKGLLGLDRSASPVRPYFEFSIGPGDKYGFLYRHSGHDAWINGLELAKKHDRFLRIIGFDFLAVAGRPVELYALVVEGVPGFLAPPVQGVRLDLYLGGRWKGNTRTDEKGWAAITVPPMEAGEYRIYFSRVGPGRSGRSGLARLTVLPDDRPVLLLRLEDMIAAGWETAFLQRDWHAIVIRQGVSERLAQITPHYALVYLTQMPLEYMASLRDQLFGGGEPLLPRGMIMPTTPEMLEDYLWTLPFPPAEEGISDVVERLVKEARFRGVPALCGISHLEQDLRQMKNGAMEGLGIPVLEGGEVDGESLLSALDQLLDPQTIEKLKMEAGRVARLRQKADKSPLAQKRFILSVMTAEEPTEQNRIAIHTEAGRIVPLIFESIDQSNIAVCLSTMMLGADRIGKKITERLIGAADRGVEVRVMVDQWLSEHSETFPNENIERLANSRVELQVRKLAHGFARIHKKTITCIRSDENGPKLTAFAGGMNWVDASFGNFAENLEGEELENPERDLFSRIEGPAALALQRDFLDAWEWTAGKALSADQRENLLPPAERFEPDPQDPFCGCPVMIVGNIPGRDRKIAHCFLSLIHSAKSHIRIEQNFPPSLVILDALSEALDRGVRVDWIFGARKGVTALLSDNINMNKAAFLLRKGASVDRWDNPVRVRIFPITVHMKAVTVDSEILYYGTANLDHVSVDKDAETMVVIPDPAVARWFEEKIYLPDFYRSTPVFYSQKSDALVVNGKEESPLDRVNRALVDSILPDQIQ